MWLACQLTWHIIDRDNTGSFVDTTFITAPARVQILPRVHPVSVCPGCGPMLMRYTPV